MHTDRGEDRHAEAKSLLAVVMEMGIQTAVNQCINYYVELVWLYSIWIIPAIHTDETQKEILVLDNQRTECGHCF
jgi:hypothetical protein